MALQTTGAISASNINNELTKAVNSQLGLNDTNARGLAEKPTGQIAYSDFYGKSRFAPGSAFLTNAGVWSLYTLPSTSAPTINIIFIGGGGGGGGGKNNEYYGTSNYAASNGTQGAISIYWGTT